MQIVTWNINSLKAREGFVGLYLDARAPDVLCLQELKLAEEQVPVDLFASRGYHVAIHGQRQWNGVLIASKTPLADVHCGLPDGDAGEARLIAATTAGLRVVNLYCPQGQDVESPKFPYKLGFYAALRAFVAERCDLTTPTVVCGDLNIAPTADDIWDPVACLGVPSFHPLEHAAFQALLDLGLTDAVRPHVPPKTYSYWDYRAGDFHQNRGMRIDHVLASAPLLPRITGAFIEREWRKKKEGLTPSDHAPVGITLAD